MAGFFSLSALKSGGGVKVTMKVAKGVLKAAFHDAGTDIAKANTLAMRDVAAIGKEYARAAVRKGGPGFQRRWPNAVRSKAYPEKGISLKPSAVVWIRSDYAGIFETGGTIPGSPYIWLPLKGVPPKYKGERTRPGNIRGLITIKRPGKPPLLGIRIKATEARASGAISTGLLSRGTAEKFTPKKRKKGGTRIRVIPLFVGISRASIKKKWNISDAVERAGRKLSERIAFYLKGSRNG